MQPAKAFIVAFAFASFAACSNSDGDKSPKVDAPANSAATATTRTPEPEKIYVPAPGDPKTHDLNITIRDKGLSYKSGTCRAIAGDRDLPDRLAFSGPDKEFENRPFKDGEFAIPKQGKSLADRTCEAKMTVTLPYAARYTAGITREGDGIAGPEDAGETKVATKGDSQDVVVINYPG